MLKIDEVVEWLNNNKSDVYINDARVSIEDLIKKLKDKDNNMSKEELLETLEEIEDALYY